MHHLTTTPDAPIPSAGYVNLSQVWVADRQHIINYRIDTQTKQATWHMLSQTCFLALDVIEQASTLHYVQQEGCTYNQPVIKLICNPRHHLAQRVEAELTEAELVMVVRFAGSDDYLVLGLDQPIRLNKLLWPALNKHKMPYTELHFGLGVINTSTPSAHGYLAPELAYTLTGNLPQLVSVSPGIGNGVFNQIVTIEGDNLFGTKRVWWGEVACSFTLINADGTYVLQIEIPAGMRGPDRQLVVLNQAGKSSEPLMYQRF